MITTVLLATLSVAGGVTSSALDVPVDRLRTGVYRPQIQLWLNSDGYYHRGDRARVYFETETDAYVTIFRIDTDGRVRVLFPHDPWQDNYVYGGRQYEVVEPYGGHGDHSFIVDEYPGQGYIFAVASYDPFDYTALTLREHWDYQAIAHQGRVTGDPYVAFDRLVDQILPAAYDDYTYDVSPYYVERRYTYPRFLCYDCHSHVAFTYWNPYRYSCVRFRLVIYDDPYYYPARVYVGTRVVYKRPVRYEPRYVFKDRVAAKPYITRERRRPVDDENRRRVIDREVSGRDVGGIGRVPAPVTRRPVRPEGRGGVTERRRVERATPQRSERDEPSRRLEPRDERPPAERPQPRRLRESDWEGGRRGTSSLARPRLERREPSSGTMTPGSVRDGGRFSDQRRPQARPAPERGPQKPSVRAPARRVPSHKQVRPSRRPDRRAAPSRRAPKPKPNKPKRKKKDPNG